MSTEAGIGLDSSWIIRALAQKVWKSYSTIIFAGIKCNQLIWCETGGYQGFDPSGWCGPIPSCEGDTSPMQHPQSDLTVPRGRQHWTSKMVLSKLGILNWPWWIILLAFLITWPSHWEFEPRAADAIVHFIIIVLVNCLKGCSWAHHNFEPYWTWIIFLFLLIPQTTMSFVAFVVANTIMLSAASRNFCPVTSRRWSGPPWLAGQSPHRSWAPASLVLDAGNGRVFPKNCEIYGLRTIWNHWGVIAPNHFVTG